MYWTTLNLLKHLETNLGTEWALSDLNLVDIMPWHLVLHSVWMSWYLSHRKICNIVLWTPICFGCRDGNGFAITLCVIVWSSSVWMIWYHIGNMMLWVSITSLLVMVEVFDLYRFCTSWCHLHLSELNLDTPLDEVLDLYWFYVLWCPSSSIRAESGHCIAIGTFGFHRVDL